MAIISPFKALLSKPQFAKESIFSGTAKPLLKGDNGMDHLKELINKGFITPDNQSALYIYQVEENGQKQTGLWAQLLSKDVKLHEHILPGKVQSVRQFRLDTGLESKPVLLTYRPVAVIASLIENVVKDDPTVIYYDELQTHRLWRVSAKELINQFTEAFAKIPSVYMADGHHRYTANPFETLSALFMDTTQIRVKPYHRLINTDKQIGDYFEIVDSDRPVLPNQKRHFGLLKDDKWYHLIAKNAGAYDSETLSALFDDIEYTPTIEGEPGKLLFTLNPLSIDEVIGTADAGTVLPPKSTWIEPKIPFGLLMHRHEIKY